MHATIKELTELFLLSFGAVIFGVMTVVAAVQDVKRITWTMGIAWTLKLGLGAWALVQLIQLRG